MPNDIQDQQYDYLSQYSSPQQPTNIKKVKEEASAQSSVKKQNDSSSEPQQHKSPKKLPNINYVQQKPTVEESAVANAEESQIKEAEAPKAEAKQSVEEKKQDVFSTMKVLKLTNKERESLENALSSAETLTDYLTAICSSIAAETGLTPFQTKPIVSPSVHEKPQSKLQQELFPEPDEPRKKAPEELDKNSAEYHAAVLGPIKSRFDKSNKSTSRPITPEEADRFQQLATEQLQEVDPENLSELDSYMLTQLPSEKMPEEAVVTTRRRDICPVDLEMDETGNISPFFNWEKTCANWGHPEWADKLKLTEEKTSTQFFKNLAKMQYNAYQKYHNLSESDKDKHDKASDLKKILIPAGAGVFLIIALLLNFIPKMTLSKGLSAIESGKYAEAQNILCEKLHSDVYCPYAQAMVLKEEGEYDKAVEIIEELIETKSANIKYDLDETKKEILYQQGLAYIAANNPAQGLLVFRKISNYKDVKEIYYRTCYEVAESKKDSDKKQSLKYYYMANEYKDAKQQFTERAEEIYLEALGYYYASNYPQAQVSFEIISPFAYKDAQDMIVQSTYRAGLDAYLKENYEVSNSFFKQIPYYKDASALIMTAEEIRRPLSDDEIEALIAATRAENPSWIMKVLIDSEGQSFTLYNGETFTFEVGSEDYEQNVELFISQHGGAEALDIVRQTRNYQSFVPTEEPDIFEVHDEEPVEETQESTENIEENTEVSENTETSEGE